MRRITQKKMLIKNPKKVREKILKDIKSEMDILAKKVQKREELTETIRNQAKVSDEKQKEIKELDKLIKERKGRIEKSQLQSQIAELKKNKEILAKETEKIKNEAVQRVKDKESEKEQLEKDISGLKTEKEERVMKNEKLREDNENLFNSVSSQGKNLKELKRQASENQSIIQTTKKEIVKLIPVRDELKALKKEKKATSQILLKLQEKVGQTQKEFEKIESEKEERTGKLNARDAASKLREEKVKVREEKSEAEEKRIKILGNTLQKHFDKHGMKHIKVFS